MDEKDKNLKKIFIDNDVDLIELSLDLPGIIPVRGYNRRCKRWEERHLKITDKGKILLV